MATLDHFILQVNILDASVALYTGITEPGRESGARGMAPTLYFNDPNKHLVEIRCYQD